MKKTIKLILYFSSVFIFSACIVYPTTQIYFEPSSPDGTAFDSTPCDNFSENPDEIKINHNETFIYVYAYYLKNENLQVLVMIEPRNNEIKISPEDFMIIDNISGSKFHPTKQIENNRKDRIATSGFGTEEVYRSRVTLFYDVSSDSLANFQLIFPENSVKMNGENIDIKPINFIRKEKKTIGYGSINC